MRQVSPMRHLPAQDYLTLKAAWRDLVALCGGTKRAAALTPGGESHISEYGAPHAERFARADQVADLEAECGQPVMSRALADLLGFDLVPREAASKPRSVLQHFAAIVKECNDVESVVAEGLADGVLTAHERQIVIKEIDQAVEQLQAMKAELRHGLRDVQQPKLHGA